MHKRFLFLILFLVFLKQIVFLSLVPIWHTPDEQSHFGQVAFLAEKGINPPYKEIKDLTEEIRKSEELLGTERDQMGINKFTYHPEFRIEYTESIFGKYEKEISDLALDLSSRAMVKHEASRYPSFYYSFIAFFYRLFYFHDLFIRVFFSRIVQTAFPVVTVYLTFLIAQIIFPNNNKLSLAAALLVGFHPMFSFVSAGVNSDNIANFIFTYYILIALRTLTGPYSLFRICILFSASIITSYFKPQFAVILPITFFIIIYQSLRKKNTLEKKVLTIFFLTAGTLMIGYFLMNFDIGPNVVFYRLLRQFDLVSYLSYLKDYAIFQAYHEVMPWYWGVYNWLGVTYPRAVHRTINWIVLFCVLGFIRAFFLRFKVLPRRTKEGIIFLVGISAVLFFGIYLYDWLEFSQRNIHLGVQGRYFFPAISSQMTVLLFGFAGLILSKEKFQLILVKIFSLSMILLNFFSLFIIARTYYDLWPISKFVVQVSQYKPWFFKGVCLVELWLFYVTLLIVFLIKYIKLSHEKKNLSRLKQ